MCWGGGVSVWGSGRGYRPKKDDVFLPLAGLYKNFQCAFGHPGAQVVLLHG